MITFERIKDQRILSLEDSKVREAVAVGQVKTRCNGLHAQTRQLGVHFEVHRFVWLHSNDKLVTRGIFEDT